MKIKLGTLTFTLIFAAIFAGCQSAQTATTNTPTEAYKNLYAAVKSKNTEAIKKMMSKTTQEFAEAMAQMQKKSLEDMYKNGLIESTMSPNLPPIRDERVKDKFGAVEVQNPDGNWQDVPFVKEEDGWKLAVGDLFKNTYESPGKPASQANANTQVPQVVPAAPSSNADTMGNVKIAPANSNSTNINANAAVKPSAPNKAPNK